MQRINKVSARLANMSYVWSTAVPAAVSCMNCAQEEDMVPLEAGKS
jgi:hypothetical protein